jgi:Tol biopolymer transport system component
MAPEQLEGKEADSRTDIFAFGAVVYEMATGKKAFEGKSQASLIAAIMGQDPRPISELQPMTPLTLDHLVRGCLEKDPDERWQNALDLTKELKWVTEVGTHVDVSPPVSASKSRERIWMPLAGGLFLLCIVLVFSLLTSLPAAEDQLATKFEVTPPLDAPLANFPGRDLAISPDGRYLLYAAESQDGKTSLYLRHMDNLTSVLIPGSEGAVSSPFFSQDSHSFVFFQGNKLKKGTVTGGAATTLTTLATTSTFRTGTWGEKGVLVVSSGTELYSVSANGGEPTLLVTPDAQEGEQFYRNPSFLPGSDAILVGVNTATGRNVVVFSLQTGERKLILEGSSEALYSPTGHLLHGREGTNTLFASSFDLENLEITGEAVPLIEDVRSQRLNAGDFDLSDNGTLVFIPNVSSRTNRLVWVDRTGKSEPLLDTGQLFDDPRVSPDGTRLSLTIFDESIVRNIWIYDIGRENLMPLTFGGINARASWTPDSERLTFLRQPPNQPFYDIYWKTVDQSGEEEQLTDTQNVSSSPSWSSKEVLVYTEGVQPERDIWILPSVGVEPVLFLGTEFDERHPRFSPDGNWIAFTSDRSGQDEVYLKSFPGPSGLIPVSNGGGSGPIWSHDGRELFYRQGEYMMTVQIQTAPTFQAGKPRVLFQGPRSSGYLDFGVSYDISEDDQHFVMLEEGVGSGVGITVILNWFEELKRLVPTDN